MPLTLHPLSKLLRFIFRSSLCVCVLCLVAPLVATAEPTYKTAIITLAPIGAATKLELVAQTFDVDVVEAGERTTLNGQLVFKLHNTDRLTRTETLLGFPSWGGGASEWNEKSFTQFAVSQDGEPIVLQPLTQTIKLGNETRAVRWLSFPVKLVEDERATIQVAFKQDVGDATLPTIVFAQAPAILWKGYVGSARFSVHFPTLTTPEQFRFVAPTGSAFDGKTLTWLFAEYNPEAPIVLQFIKPRIWRELTQARKALAQNGDAKAALTLGAQYAQLARATRAATDFAQAVGAYQRASELDPSASNAPLELAKLYEAQLRGEFGQVDDENAVRAAALEQWQRVLKLSPNNTDARDAVAQHAFTLAQLARRGNHFSGALTLLDVARTAGSSKITRAQLDGETRANQAGLALQEMDAGQWSETLALIQVETFGAEAKNEGMAFAPRFTGAQTSVRVEGDDQVVSARVFPFPAPSAEHEKILNEWLASARRQTAMEGGLTLDGDGYVLTMRLAAKPLRASDLSATVELWLLRETLSPSDLRVIHSDGTFTHDDTFFARYAFTESQRVAQGKADEIERALKALSAPSADEPQEIVRRLRVRALEQYKAGWQSLLSGSSARVEWAVAAPELGKREVWELRPGDARTLQAQRTTYQVWAIVGVAGLLVGLLMVVA
ncbi:MAG: hypothetical protein ABI874_07615, partial [Chloroflexota bacterium]